MKQIFTLVILSGLIFCQCTSMKKSTDASLADKGLQMAIRMADSEMTFFPKCSTVDFDSIGAWNYTPGLISSAMIELWKTTGEDKYYEYAKGYADQFINDDGQINGYKREDFNIDKVNSGKFLFEIYKQTREEKYKKAIEILRGQLNDHPRTSEGGFWHKKRYPHQMWLDGLYMGSPFYAQFGKEFGEPAAFDDVINQFVTVHKYTYDSVSCLNYHGWDESHEQEWADSITGCSPNFWGRAMGWYSMALVDVLDFLPKNYEGRQILLDILNDVAVGIKKSQDIESGLWYQVLDKGEMEGNYLEASASSMFVYSLLKATRLQYINNEYRTVAEKGYSGILNNLIKENEDGTISLTRVCAVAGLGGNPYRSGTYEYYIGETIRDNDPKGVGPFILASLEMNK